MENPIKVDDLGGPPLFLETPKSTHGKQKNNTKLLSSFLLLLTHSLKLTANRP